MIGLNGAKELNIACSKPPGRNLNKTCISRYGGNASGELHERYKRSNDVFVLISGWLALIKFVQNSSILLVNHIWN